MADAPVCIVCEASGALADLALLEHAADLSLQVRELVFDLLGRGLQLACIHVDPATTAGAREVRTHFQLADPLRDLAAAVRAGNFDGVVVQDRCHGGPFHAGG